MQLDLTTENLAEEDTDEKHSMARNKNEHIDLENIQHENGSYDKDNVKAGDKTETVNYAYEKD